MRHTVPTAWPTRDTVTHFGEQIANEWYKYPPEAATARQGPNEIEPRRLTLEHLQYTTVQQHQFRVFLWSCPGFDNLIALYPSLSPWGAQSPWERSPPMPFPIRTFVSAAETLTSPAAGKGTDLDLRPDPANNYGDSHP